jgi:hypothetical protein
MSTIILKLLDFIKKRLRSFNLEATFYGLGSVHHDKVESSRWQNGVSKYQWLGPESNQIAWLRASCINCLDGCLNDYLRLAHHVAIVLLMHPFSDLAVFSCHNCTI